MKNFFIGCLLIIAVCILGLRWMKSIQFDQQCGGYLKQAADANTVEIALERLTLAINYIEKHNLTNGYTSILYNTEDENIEFWYKNLKACQSELQNCFGCTQLEKSNVLMKVRESLTDNKKNGTTLTIPDGIYIYPNNLVWAILTWFSILVFAIFVIILYIKSY